MFTDLFQNLKRPFKQFTNAGAIEYSEKVDKMLKETLGRSAARKMKRFSMRPKTRKVRYKELEFNSFDWHEVDVHEQFKIWVCKKYPAWLTLHYFDQKPDLPSANIKAIRKKSRNRLGQSGGGILKEEIKHIEDIPVVESITKMPQEEYGMVYFYSMIIPFEDRSYVLKLEIEEPQPTGVRDSIIGSILLDESQKEPTDFFENWNRDPYKPDFSEGIPMNIAEQEKYDQLFPFHPLTILRKELIPNLRESLAFDSSVYQSKPFLRQVA